MYVRDLVCTVCGRSWPPPESAAQELYTCPACGLPGILEVRLDLDRVPWPPRHDLAQHPFYGQTLWRYLDLLPVPADAELPTLQVGLSPVSEVARAAQWVGVRSLWLKDDGRGPTASYKDRASAVGAVRAKAKGRQVVAAASTGNAACSLAGVCANLGLQAVIFVPASAPEAKVAQLRAFGARVLLVESHYGDAWDLCERAVQKFGWYDRNCAVNPWLVEGKKTGGFEIADQFAQLGLDMPDWVVLSVGDGCTVAGVWKGLCEAKTLGLVPRLPRLLAVQAEGAAPLARAFQANTEDWQPCDANTVADSISVGVPRNPLRALRAVRASGGTFVTVSDEAILHAAARTAAMTGIFAEPTAAASVAGLLEARANGIVAPADRVLVMVTGNGLKDVRGATAQAPAAHAVPVDLEAVHAACRDLA